MRTSEQTNEFMAAMAKAQANIKNPAKNKLNPHFKTKYADLADGLDAIRPALSAQGIAFLQAPTVVDGYVILVTRLGHSSGQWIECDYPVGSLTMHQKLGGDMTYAKRQSIFSIVGVCGDDDLDGEEGSKEIAPQPKTYAKPAARAPIMDEIPFGDVAPELVSEAQARDLDRMLNETGSDRAKFLTYFDVPSIDDLPRASYIKATEMLNAKRKAA